VRAGVIRVNSEKLQDVATKSRSRAMPSEGSATLRPHKDKERGGGDDDGDGEGRSQGKSMWTNGFGFKIEEGRGAYTTIHHRSNMRRQFLIATWNVTTRVVSCRV
jgi:hypothetical protein